LLQLQPERIVKRISGMISFAAFRLRPASYGMGPRFTTSTVQQRSEVWHVSLGHQSRLAQTTLPFRGLLGQDVTGISTLSFDFSAGGETETLGRPSMCL
jgi:hypothetical protein